MSLYPMSESESMDGDSGQAQISPKKAQALALTDALVELGVSVGVVRVMVCLYLNGDTTSKNLQKSCDLRQPEISTAIKQLSLLSIVETRRSGSEGRGRPSHIYTLGQPIKACVDILLVDVEKRIKTMQEGVLNAERLSAGLD